MGPNCLDYLQGRVFLEHHDVIDTIQGSQRIRPCVGRGQIYSTHSAAADTTFAAYLSFCLTSPWIQPRLQANTFTPSPRSLGPWRPPPRMSRTEPVACRLFRGVLRPHRSTDRRSDDTRTAKAMSARRSFWWKWITEKLGFNGRRPARPRQKRQYRPTLEMLEERLVPSVLTVNTTSDLKGASPYSSPYVSGSTTITSLRSAMEYINHVGLSGVTIEFSSSISGGAIDLNSSYGALAVTDTTGRVTITGAGEAITVSGQNAVQDFNLATGATVTIDDLTISGGSRGHGRRHQ